MDPGSKSFTVCVSVASISGFIGLVAIVLFLVWIWLRQVSPQERELVIADSQRQLRDAEERMSSSSFNLHERQPISRRQDEDLRKVKEVKSQLSKALEENTNLKEKVEIQGRELEAQRRRTQTLGERLQNERQRVAGRNSQMNPTELEGMRSQMEELKAENAHLKAQARAEKKRIAEMKQHDPGMQNGEERYQLQRANRALQGKDEELREASQMNETLSRQLDDECKRFQDIFARNQYLQDELKAARKYGSLEDQYAGAEVIDKVEKLNSEILQVAATMVEGLDVDKWANDRLAVDGSNGKNLAGTIGRDLIRLLNVAANQDLNIVLQTAFQASMAYYTMWIVSSWCYGDVREERLFNECYRSMQRNEFQAVYGRWRQLAKTHLKGSRPSYEKRLMPALAATLADIIVTSGYRQDPTIVHKQIIDRFGHHLDEVIKAAQDLHRVIGEEVTSCDLTVAWYHPGTLYDPGLMEDAFSPSSTNGREEVSCVMDIGLWSSEKVSGSSRAKSVLLKPKVVLLSGLTGIRERNLSVM